MVPEPEVVDKGEAEERRTLIYPITVAVRTLGAQAAVDAPPSPPPADDDRGRQRRRPPPSSTPAALDGPVAGGAPRASVHSRMGPSNIDGNVSTRGDAPVLPPAAGDAARWRSATNTTRSGTHDVALGLSRANFVDLNRTRESGAAKRCSLFGYALYYLFSVLTRSETHDHPATRARAATRPPNARERSSCTTWR